MKILLPIIFLILLIGCSNESKIERIDGSKIERGKLTEKIQSLMQAANVTGLAISIFNNSEVVYQKAFGYERADSKDTLSVNSIFYGASLSKAVFAQLVMQLVEEGTIDLDTPLQNYLDKPLPEYKFEKSWR